MKRLVLNSNYAFLMLLATAGCCINKNTCSYDDIDSCAPVAVLPSVTQLQIDEPGQSCEVFPESVSPEELDPDGEIQYWDLTLEQAIELALQHSEVMRDLGGTVLRSPISLATARDPAITYTDPRFGEEAALSFFDATLNGSATWDKNDRQFNNAAIGSNGSLQQDLGTYGLELTKRSATGTIMSLRHLHEYDSNNSVANLFGRSTWNSIVEAEVRQPFLQGGGINFNRIAGPSNEPGIINGVLVSRIRTDISLAEFETGLRDLVSNVENTYWDLYFAYRDLDAKKRARDKALEAWQDVKAKMDAEDEGGEADKEGQAREQYWRFEAEVIDSLNGRLLQATQNANGSSGGTFRNVPGVRVAERRLRLAVGLPITDTNLVRPAEEPPEAPVRYDWNTVVNEAYELRPELRRQRWLIKQRQLELTANKNFLLPRLDAVGRYRLRGLGDKLLSAGERDFNDSIGELGSLDYQEWQFGVEFSVPIGFRRAHAAVRNSELLICRERAILEEQKRAILYGLSNAVSDVRRAYEVVNAQYNRYSAAESQVAAVKASFEQGRAPLDLLLEAQRRMVDAETRFHQSRIDYALALKNVQFEKGTLLEYYSVRMAEGPSTCAAYRDAAERECEKGEIIDYVCRDVTVSRGRATEGQLDYPIHDAIQYDDSSGWYEGSIFEDNATKEQAIESMNGEDGKEIPSKDPGQAPSDDIEPKVDNSEPRIEDNEPKIEDREPRLDGEIRIQRVKEARSLKPKPLTFSSSKLKPHNDKVPAAQSVQDPFELHPWWNPERSRRISSGSSEAQASASLFESKAAKIMTTSGTQAAASPSTTKRNLGQIQPAAPRRRSRSVADPQATERTTDLTGRAKILRDGHSIMNNTPLKTTQDAGERESTPGPAVLRVSAAQEEDASNSETKAPRSTWSRLR